MMILKRHSLKFTLLNSCLVLIWGCSPSPVLETRDLASEVRKLSAPIQLNIDTSNATRAVRIATPADPIIAYTLRQIEKAQEIPRAMSPEAMTPDANCATCQTPEPQNFQYMTCNRSNGYLEQELASISDKNSLLADLIKAPISDEGLIKPSCVRMSMEAKFDERSNTFRSCNANGQASRAIRPCISEKYFKLMTNSFDTVSSCLQDYFGAGESLEDRKQDIRDVFAMITQESGFHVNARSGTGASGIGQLTDDAIKDANRVELPKIREVLSASNNPVCKKILDEHLLSATPMRYQSAYSCDRISLRKGNPVMNMVYTYANLMWNKNYLNDAVFEEPRYKAKFNLKEEDMNKIKRAMMIWAHNTGIGGARTPLTSFLNREFRTKKVTDADAFIQRMSIYMRDFPHTANRGRARRNETSKYYPTLSGTMNRIETNVGGGSCVN